MSIVQSLHSDRLTTALAVSAAFASLDDIDAATARLDAAAAE